MSRVRTAHLGLVSTASLLGIHRRNQPTAVDVAEGDLLELAAKVADTRAQHLTPGEPSRADRFTCSEKMCAWCSKRYEVLMGAMTLNFP